MAGLSDLGEFGLLRQLTKRLGQVPTHVRVGIGDDTAVVSHPSGSDMLITTDTMVQGVHFTETTMSWFDVGYKVMVASISDIAAMGGEPHSGVLSIAVPASATLPSLEEMYDGVAKACTSFQCPLVGGDIVSTSGPIVLTSTVTGVVPEGTALLRSGARPGDVVFVTGTVGGSGAGLDMLQSGVTRPADESIFLRQAHQRPVPQVSAGRILRTCHASSCNDVSDGLASELSEISEASGVRMRVEEDRLPIAPAVKNYARSVGREASSFALYGGEDYQLVGTASSFAFAKALSMMTSVGLMLTQIGRVEPGDGVVAEDSAGRTRQLQPKGFNHFREEES